MDIDPKATYITNDHDRVLLINKPLHWTSFQAVNKIRYFTGIKKVGHAGTLDPLATGLLIVCTGKKTKEINSYMGMEKQYTGTFTVGSTTPSYDLETTPTESKDYSGLTIEDLENAKKHFVGEILQIPPQFSAIKKNGVRLYETARMGIEIEVEARKVTIYDFSITQVQLPLVYFDIVCSTGTYIRSLAHDFGKKLGVGAYLSSLCRVRIGDFHLSDALEMETFNKKPIKEDKNTLDG